MEKINLSNAPYLGLKLNRKKNNYFQPNPVFILAHLNAQLGERDRRVDKKTTLKNRQLVCKRKAKRR